MSDEHEERVEAALLKIKDGHRELAEALLDAVLAIEAEQPEPAEEVAA
jgi:hypothetical protein